MSSPEGRWPLQAFIEAVEQRLAVYSAKELRAIVRVLAQATPAAARQAFLDTVQSVGATVEVAQTEAISEALLADIATLTDEIEAATEEGDDESWDEYHDEDSLGPYAEFVEPLTDLFERAALAFDTGNIAMARLAYHDLFAILSIEDDYGRGVRVDDLPDIDIRAARARYLRAVYDLEPLEQRPAVLFEEMCAVQSWLAGPRPRLADLLQITADPLPEQASFFVDWLAFLRTQSGSDADAWLREAVRLSEGSAGLAALARAEGQQRPRAYLDWCAALEAEGNMPAVLAAAHEALRALPEPLPLRAAVADYLCTAATHLQDTATLRTGRWEAFRAKPTLARLLDVWEATVAGSARIECMREAAQHVQDVLAHPSSQAIDDWQDALESPVAPSKAVLVHAYLLAGDWDAAYHLAVSEQVLGWSSSHNAQGLVVVGFLVCLSETLPDKLPANLMQLWQLELQNSTGLVAWHSTDTGEASLLMRLQRMYAESLPAAPWTQEQHTTMLAWCLDIAQRRIDAIVRNQHRGSYDKAALLLVACAEVLHRQGRPPEATALIEGVRQRFPRHRAFQTEVQAAIRRMGISLSRA